LAHCEVSQGIGLSGWTLAKSDLGKFFSIAKSTASEAVNRWKDQGLVKEVGKIGKEVYWGLTERGKERLGYFDGNEYGNPECSCYESED